MGKKRRQYTAEFKLEVIREYETGKSSLELSRKHGFHPSLINRWRKAYQEHGIGISMSRKGMPTDNAVCERFMRTLKEEEVYLYFSQHRGLKKDPGLF